MEDHELLQVLINAVLTREAYLQYGESWINKWHDHPNRSAIVNEYSRLRDKSDNLHKYAVSCIQGRAITE